MSILGWLLKLKKELAKPYTKLVKLGKYSLTSHAQNRIADPKRDLKKRDLLQNLFGKSQNSNVYTHKDGTRQYDRVNSKNHTVTNITKDKILLNPLKNIIIQSAESDKHIKILKK